MKLNIGSVVEWTPALGTLTGTVTGIHLDLNGAGNTVPWITIKRDDTGTNVMLCGIDGNLKSLRLRLLEKEEV